MNDDRDDTLPGRRRFLECMAWAGAGTLWLMQGGVPHAGLLGKGGATADATFSFVQISDSHIGFSQAPNPDPVASLRRSIASINALPQRPDFVMHTGDLTHLSKPDQLDTVAELLKEARTGHVFYIPGEHDVIGDDGKAFFARFGAGVDGNGWYSFNHGGVHFVALVNVRHLTGGLGFLGPDQLAWLKQDLAAISASTPIVVFAHMPMWSLYPAWGWGTRDSAQALALLRRFGSVTVLNGHVHQIQQKVEGNVVFHTARSTAYPQPAPGAAPTPGPLKTIPAAQLHAYIGTREARHVRGSQVLAVTDRTLAAPASAMSSAGHAVSIRNYQFVPARLVVPAGTTVTWSNYDDDPHTVSSSDQRFQSSPILEHAGRYSATFVKRGNYAYFCAVHPQMRATIVVR